MIGERSQVRSSATAREPSFKHGMSWIQEYEMVWTEPGQASEGCIIMTRTCQSISSIFCQAGEKPWCLFSRLNKTYELMNWAFLLTHFRFSNKLGLFSSSVQFLLQSFLPLYAVSIFACGVRGTHLDIRSTMWLAALPPKHQQQNLPVLANLVLKLK